MATIRTAAIAGVAFVALVSQAAPSAAQTVRCLPNAPLQIVPQAYNSSPCVASPRAARKRAVKADTKSAPKTLRKRAPGLSKRVKAADRPAAKKTARAAAVAKKIAPPRTRTPVQASKDIEKGKVVARGVPPRAMKTPTVASPAADPAPPAASKEMAQAKSDDDVVRGKEKIASLNVMRGEDLLLAKLPWWRSDRTDDSADGANKVLAAVDAWMTGNDGSAVNLASEEAFAFMPPADAVVVADAGEINAVDLAAKSPPPPSVAPTAPHSLLALLGGAGAALLTGLGLLLWRRRSLAINIVPELALGSRA